MMNKRDLIAAWADRIDIPAYIAQDYLAALLALIETRLIEGDAVRLTGIGVVFSKSSADGRRRLRLRPSRRLKRRLQDFLRVCLCDHQHTGSKFCKTP
jgi:DNA-binding protein